MNVGIIGHGADKFTPRTSVRARHIIRNIILGSGCNTTKPIIVSGHSPMGGVDIWAEESATKLNCPTLIFAPKQQMWSAEYGYKERNLDIAAKSDVLHVILVDKYPEGYVGMRFPNCYHCNSTTHVKSGACWTAKRFTELHDKAAEYWVLKNQ